MEGLQIRICRVPVSTRNRAKQTHSRTKPSFRKNIRNVLGILPRQQLAVPESAELKVSFREIREILSLTMHQDTRRVPLIPRSTLVKGRRFSIKSEIVDV